MNEEMIAMGNHVVHNNTSIAECHNSTWDVQLQNAKLFSSARDLLESLRDMVDAMESYGYSHSPEIITARAAIAKATK